MLYAALSSLVCALIGGTAVYPIVATAVNIDRESPLRDVVLLLWGGFVSLIGDPNLAAWCFGTGLRSLGVLLAVVCFGLLAQRLSALQWSIGVGLALVLPVLYFGMLLLQGAAFLELGITLKTGFRHVAWELVIVAGMGFVVLESLVLFWHGQQSA